MTSPLLELAAGALRVDIAPALGGSVARFYSLDDAGGRADWLRPASAQDLASGDPRRLACFPMLPYANRLRDGCFEFQGRRIELAAGPHPHALHGQAWLSAWEVESQSPDQITLGWHEEGRSWPFPYCARQTFELTPQALTITLEVHNTGTTAMPLGLGLHPYFPRPEGTRWHAELGTCWAVDDQGLPTGECQQPDWTQQREFGFEPGHPTIDHCFSPWWHEARIAWPDGRGLLMRADAPLDLLHVYAPSSGRCFCLEPVSNAPDWLNLLRRKPGHDCGGIVLGPGARLQTCCCFQPLPQP